METKRPEFSAFKIGDRVRWYSRPGTIIEFEGGRPVVCMDEQKVYVGSPDHFVRDENEN
jgi:hypothetical protein